MSELASDDPRHGTLNGYNSLGCRCDECRAAAREWNRAYSYRSGRRRPMEVYLAEIRSNPPAHGTESRYNSGCRCDECRQAATAARRQRRQANPERDAAYHRAYNTRRRAKDTA